MVTVRFIYMNNHVNIKTDYNLEVNRTLKQFQAKYYSRGKMWSLPLERVDDIKRELIIQGHKVLDIGNQEYKVYTDATTD